MTYRKKRERVASTAPPTSMSEDASQPTKKYDTEQTSQVPTTIKWGPFSPPTGTTSKVVAPYVNTLKSAQQPPNENKVGPVWKNPPTGSSASSLKAQTTTSLKVSSLATSSCKAPEALPPKVPSSSNSPASSSHKVPNLPSGYEGKKSSTLSSVSSPNIPYSMASKPLKYPSNSSPNSDQPLKYPVTNSKPSTSSPNSNQPLKYPVTNSKPSTSSPNSEQPLKYPATNSNPSASPNSNQPLKYPAANSNSHSLREKREEQPGVGHNEASEKGSKPLKSLRSKSHPDWPTFIDFDDKEEVMTIGELYDKASLKHVNKSWRQYKFTLKRDHYKPEEKSLEEMCNAAPPHGISSQNWTLGACGKAARANLNQLHRSGCKSFANRQADYEDEHGEKMSLLALWIQAHTGKDGSFLPGTVTEDFVDDAKAKVEELRMLYPSKSQQELEDEAFEQTMHGGEIPDRPIGYGLGVRKNDIYGVHALLRKDGSRKIRQRTVVMDNKVKEVSALQQKNEVLEKENEKLKDQVQENNNLLKTLIGQFSQVVVQFAKERVQQDLWIVLNQSWEWQTNRVL